MHRSNVLYYGATSTGAIVVPPIVRPPLPQPLPRLDRDGVPWSTLLPWIPPQSRDYLRANLWAVEMPGAPVIDRGVSSIHPERILSWFIDRYPIEFQRDYLTKYGGFGYTHLYLSPPDSLAAKDQPPDKPPGAGRTLAQFCDTVRLCKQYVPYVGIMLASKYFQPANMTPAEFQRYVDPLLEALLPIADEFVPAWEWNLWNRTAPDAITIHRYIGERCHAVGRSCWQHYSPHYTNWHADGDPRGRYGWYDDLGDTTDGLNYQGDSRWTTQDAADRAVDTLHQFGEQQWGHKFRYFEDVAWLQWNGDPQTGFPPDYATGDVRGPGITADDGDARGYYLCCTYDNVKHTDAKVWGFGNGGRLPDGGRI